MSISPINTANKSIEKLKNKIKKVNTVSTTGYASIAFGVASAYAARKRKISLHKSLAYISGIFAVLHVGIIEWYKYKYRKK